MCKESGGEKVERDRKTGSYRHHKCDATEEWAKATSFRKVGGITYNLALDILNL